VSVLAVKASGMVTSVGFNSRASCAAMRAGIRGVNETNLWDAETGTYLAAGKVSLPHWWVGLGKFAELVAPAINECLQAANSVHPTAIPILLGVSSPDRPHRFDRFDEQILEEIAYRLGFPLNRRSHVISHDRVSILLALREGAKLIDAGEAPCFIVAGVDSLIQQELVEHFLEQRRLLTPKNSNGFSPGEAGSAILVSQATLRATGELRIRGMGLGREQATIDSEEPFRSAGLIQAIGEALREASCKVEDLHYRVTDLNGERYKFKEMVLAMMRYERERREGLFDLWHPIEYIGDVGAAIGPIVLGVALDAGQNQYGPGPNVLCTFGNDNGERGALVASIN
jgi:3-oxoacyl-[acyl-carrier-protein] synthase-1